MSSHPLSFQQIYGMHPLITFWATGDGVTDDTAAINTGLAAIASTAPVGSNVEFPAGNYLISGNGIVVPAGITLVGHGTVTRIFNNGMNAGFGMVNFSNSNGGIRNLLLDGNVTVSTQLLYGSISTPYDTALTQNSSVWVHPGATDIKFTQVTVMHTGGYAFIIDSSTANTARITFSDCDFHDNRPHVFSVSGGTYGGSWTGGIYLHMDGASSLFTSQTLTVVNCRWRRCTGHGLWSHANGLNLQFSAWTISNLTFEDMGLDCILVENVFNVSITNVTGHRIGYITGAGGSDTDTPVPVWIAGHNAVGLDHGGYVRAFTYSGIAFSSVNGECFDLDGCSDGSLTNISGYIPVSGEPAFTVDSIASYLNNGHGINSSRGIQTGNTNLNGGAQYITISGAQFRGLGASSVVLAFAKFCTARGITISQPALSSEVPIQLLAASGSAETLCHDNTVEDNTIDYSGSNYCVLEIGTGWTTSHVNHVQGNWVTGSNFGEFLRNSGSASSTAMVSSSNSSGLGTFNIPTSGRWQTENADVNASLKLYGAWSSSGIPAGAQVVQVNFVGPVFNCSNNGSAGTGAFATGNVTTVGISDSMNTARFVGSGYLMLSDGTGDTSANGIDGISVSPTAHWLLRWNHGTGVPQQSFATDGSGNRIWVAFGSGGTPPGSDTQIIYNNAGAYGAAASFTFNNSTNQVTLSASVSGLLLYKVNNTISSGSGSLGAFQAINDTGVALTCGVNASSNTAFPTQAFLKCNGGISISCNNATTGIIVFFTNTILEAMRIDVNGSLIMGSTTIPSTATGAQLYGTGFVSFDGGIRTHSSATNAIDASNGSVLAKFGSFTGTSNPVIQVTAAGGSIQAPLFAVTDSIIWTAESAPGLSGTNQARIYLDSGTLTLKVSINAGAYVGFGGVTSLTGTANQVTCSASTGAVTLSLPQDIATTSNVVFNLATVGEFSATNGFVGGVIVTPTAICFQTASAHVQITQGGDISCTGIITSSGGSGAITVTGNTAFNSINTVGAVSTANGYYVGATQVINSAGQFIGGIVTTSGISAAGFNPTGLTGQTYDIGPLPAFPVNGSGSFTHIHFTGGAVTSVT